MRAVVNHFAGACNGSCFEEVDSEAIASEDAVVRLDPVEMEVADATACDVVIREAGYEFRIESIVCEGYRNVGFAAAESGVELFCLCEAEVSGG